MQVLFPRVVPLEVVGPVQQTLVRRHQCRLVRQCRSNDKAIHGIVMQAGDVERPHRDAAIQ